MERRASHPLDPLVRWRWWRGLMLAFAFLFAAGFLGASLQLFDVGLLQHVIVGTAWERSWEDVQEATWTYQMVMAGAAVAGLVAFALTVYGWWVDREGGAYWYYRRTEARRLLAERGNTDPRPYQLAWALMQIEHEEDGWRPETVLRFLAASLEDAQAPIDKAWLDGIKAWSVQARRAADDHLRSKGANYLMELSGADYDAEDVATMTEQIDDRLMDLRFRDDKPFPTQPQFG